MCTSHLEPFYETALNCITITATLTRNARLTGFAYAKKHQVSWSVSFLPINNRNSPQSPAHGAHGDLGAHVPSHAAQVARLVLDQRLDRRTVALIVLDHPPNQLHAMKITAQPQVSENTRAVVMMLV